MSGPSFDVSVRRERSRLKRLARADPGVVYLGSQTGQVALHLDPPVDGVHRAFVTVTIPPPIRERLAPYYHAVVHRRTEDGLPDPRRELFRHPFPALERIHEMVPDFDLLETVCVDGSEEAMDGGGEQR